MDFISIDFETATRERNSPCEIGLTFVKDNKVINTLSWLIKPIQYPDFDSFNVYLHGITPRDVSKQPEFDTLWHDKILPLIEGKFLIAHNASFDFSVLRKTLETYDIPFPTLQYSCSYIISKKVIKGLLSYDLSS
ncbi:MAG: exonuclease domain-containing protein, partial [Saprospiraceae bacterium]